jgi:hypothetical protein
VRGDGTKAFEMVFEDNWSYRAFRHDWSGTAARPELWFEATSSEATLYFTKFGDPDVAQYNIYRGKFPEPTNLVGTTPENSFVLEVAPFENFYVRVTAVSGTEGTESPFSNELFIFVPIPVDVSDGEDLGSPIALHQNHPNPFSPGTTIPFALPEERLVELSIYDVRGRLVRSLVHDVRAEGWNEVIWDGTDTTGRRAGSGVYFYRLTAGDQTITRRMALLR